MITFEELKHILNTEIPFNELKKNEGILEFYEIGNISIGISYEEDDEGNDCYIYNLFSYKDITVNKANNIHNEYINIGNTGSSEQPINDLIINELIENIFKYIK